MTQQVHATVVPEAASSRLTADIYETAGGDAYVIEIPVPGLKPDEIVLEVTSYTLTVSTEPQQAEPNSGRRYIQREQPVRPMRGSSNSPSR